MLWDSTGTVLSKTALQIILSGVSCQSVRAALDLTAIDQKKQKYQ